MPSWLRMMIKKGFFPNECVDIEAVGRRCCSVVRSKSTGVGVGDGLYPGEIVDRTGSYPGEVVDRTGLYPGEIVDKIGLFPLIGILLVLIFPTKHP